MVALTGVGFSAYLISAEPDKAFRHYSGLLISIVIALLLFVVAVTRTPKATAFPSAHRQIDKPEPIVRTLADG
jgi:hypothetical protein